MSSRQSGIRMLPRNDSRQIVEVLGWDTSIAGPRKAKGSVKNHAAANVQHVRARSEQNRLDKLNGSSSASAPLGSRNSSRADSKAAAQPASRLIGRDFVKENAAHVRSARRSDSGSKPQQAALHTRGEVPTYLVQRKMELAQQYAEQLAEKERSLLPPGMRIMAEEERLQTLATLRGLREQAEGELQALPFVAETVSQRRYQEQLQARMSELDDAIRTFSRPKVLVEA